MFGATSGYRNDGDNGLVKVGCRYYDPEVGRFTTRDTDLSQKGYVYCEADPINSVDPTGHSKYTDIGGWIGAIAGLVLVVALLPVEVPVLVAVTTIVVVTTAAGADGGAIGGTIGQINGTGDTPVSGAIDGAGWGFLIGIIYVSGGWRRFGKPIQIPETPNPPGTWPPAPLR